MGGGRARRKQGFREAGRQWRLAAFWLAHPCQHRPSGVQQLSQACVIADLQSIGQQAWPWLLHGRLQCGRNSSGRTRLLAPIYLPAVAGPAERHQDQSKHNTGELPCLFKPR